MLRTSGVGISNQAGLRPSCCLGLLMEFLKCQDLPWPIKQWIEKIALGKRCQWCDERVGLLYRIDDEYHQVCVICVTQVRPDVDES